MKKYLSIIVAIIMLMLNIDLVLAATVTLNGAACAEPCVVSIISGVVAPVPVPAPTPTPAPADTCAAQGLQNTVVAFDWGAGYLKDFNMSSGQSLSFILPVAAGDAGRITTVYGGTQKVISISAQKCDFSQALATKNCLGGGGDPGIGYVGGASRFNCPLAPGNYYVNIRNAVTSGSMPVYPLQDSCVGACRFSITY